MQHAINKINIANWSSLLNEWKSVIPRYTPFRRQAAISQIADSWVWDSGRIWYIIYSFLRAVIINQ